MAPTIMIKTLSNSENTLSAWRQAGATLIQVQDFYLFFACLHCV